MDDVETVSHLPYYHCYFRLKIKIIDYGLQTIYDNCIGEKLQPRVNHISWKHRIYTTDYAYYVFHFFICSGDLAS